MKIIVIIILLIIPISAQNSSPIDDLYSNDDNVVWAALEDIKNENLQEAIPVIVDIISTKSPVTQIQFLETLAFFHAAEINSVAHELINRADDFAAVDPAFDPLIAKVRATSALFQVMDYSTTQYVFDLINMEYPIVSPSTTLLLPFIIENVSEYSSQAYDALVYAYQSVDKSNSLYFFIVDNLARINYNEIGDDIIDEFINNVKFESRMFSLKVLISYNTTDAESILLNQLPIDPAWSLRIAIADSLLSHFGKPLDLKTVIDYQPTEPEETAKSLMQYSIQEFIPPRPAVSTSEMIVNLDLYTDQLYQYGWITTEERYNSYKNLINQIKKFYNRSKLNELCSSLNQLLSNSFQDVQYGYITQEGYKFLYYHGIYIKENVETELGTCP